MSDEVLLIGAEDTKLLRRETGLETLICDDQEMSRPTSEYELMMFFWNVARGETKKKERGEVQEQPQVWLRRSPSGVLHTNAIYCIPPVRHFPIQATAYI